MLFRIWKPALLFLSSAALTPARLPFLLMGQGRALLSLSPTALDQSPLAGLVWADDMCVTQQPVHACSVRS